MEQFSPFIFGCRPPKGIGHNGRKHGQHIGITECGHHVDHDVYRRQLSGLQCKFRYESTQNPIDQKEHPERENSVKKQRKKRRAGCIPEFLHLYNPETVEKNQDKTKQPCSRDRLLFRSICFPHCPHF